MLNNLISKIDLNKYVGIDDPKSVEELIKVLQERKLKPAEMNITLRKLNHWTDRRLLPQQPKSGGHRKFSMTEAIWISIIEEMRSIGYPLDVANRIYKALFIGTPLGFPFFNPSNQRTVIICEEKSRTALENLYSNQEDISPSQKDNIDNSPQFIIVDQQISHLTWYIIKAITSNTPISILINHAEKDFRDMVQVVGEGAMFRIPVGWQSYSKIMIYKSLQQISNIEFFDDCDSNKVSLSPAENELIFQVRQFNYKSINVSFDARGNINLIKGTKTMSIEEKDVEKNIPELLEQYPYQDIKLKKSGNRLSIEREIKIKPNSFNKLRNNE
jgi:DNA-binding transcriptional MerR regulator